MPYKTIPEQVSRMSEAWPGFSSEQGRNYAIWNGPLAPHGRSYEIRITYSWGFEDRRRLILPTFGRARDGALAIVPHVEVLYPRLANPAVKAAQIPHLYASKPHPVLCLYFPGDGSWSPRLYIADSIVHYTIGWLSAFEFWEASGEWVWPETHFRTGDPEVDRWETRNQNRLQTQNQDDPESTVSAVESYPGLQIGAFEYFRLTGAVSRESCPQCSLRALKSVTSMATA
jgi:hypothetical protein